MKTYLSVYLGSAFLALVITPVVIFIARRLKVADHPGVRTVHKEPIPRIGGVAIFVAMMSLVIAVLFLQNTIGDSFRQIRPQVISLLAASSFMFLIGLVDDIRGLRARYKLAGQLIAAIAVCSFGIQLNGISVENLFTIHFGWLSWPITIFWIVGLTNAVNLIDGLDGLAVGISLIACGVIALLAVYFGNPIMAVFMLALMGSLTGFLFFNFNPAKIFLGDSGSLFLGFCLATSSILCSVKSHTLVGLALPVIALGIPVFDTLFSMLRRFLQRRAIFAPDEEHFHHRLLKLGLRQRHAVLAVYAATLIMTGLGLFMIATRSLSTVVVFVCLLILLVLVFRIVGSVRLRETIEGLRKKYTVASEVSEELRSFETAQLHFRRAADFDQWWDAVSFAAEQLDFLSVNLPLTNRDGTSRTMQWLNKSNDSASEELLRVDVPIRDRRSGLGLNLKIEVYKGGSLESAGRKVALFARLIEECNISQLPKHNNLKYDIRNLPSDKYQRSWHSRSEIL